MSLKSHINILLEDSRNMDAKPEEELRQYAKLLTNVKKYRENEAKSKTEAEEFVRLFQLFGMSGDGVSVVYEALKKEIANVRAEIKKCETEIEKRKAFCEAMRRKDYKAIWEDALGRAHEDGQIAAIYSAFASSEKGTFDMLSYFAQGEGSLTETVGRYLLEKALIAQEQKSSDGENALEFDKLCRQIMQDISRDKNSTIWKSIDACIRIRQTEQVLAQCERRLQNYYAQRSNEKEFIHDYESDESKISKQLDSACDVNVRGKEVTDAIAAAREWRNKSFMEMNNSIRKLKEGSRVLEESISKLETMIAKLQAGREDGLDEKALDRINAEMAEMEKAVLKGVTLMVLNHMRREMLRDFSKHIEKIQTAVKNETDRQASSARSRIRRRENVRSWIRNHRILTVLLIFIISWISFGIGRVIILWDKDIPQEHIYVKKELSLEEVYSVIPEDAKYWNGHYYQVYDGCKTWEEAREYCESLGGHLATIESYDENNAISNFFDDAKYIGYQDNVKEGEWEWVTDEAISFTAWEYSEDALGESLGLLNQTDYALLNCDSMQWRAVKYAGKDAQFICEWDVAPETILSKTTDLLQSDMNFLDELLMMGKAYVENGYAYYVLNDCSSTQEMLDKCESIGGTLVTLQSDEESEIVRRAITYCGWDAAVIGLTTAYITDSTDCYWYWYNGETANYTSWENGAPRDSKYLDNWAVIDTVQPYWWTTPIEPVTTFICEWKLETEVEQTEMDMSHPAYYSDCSIPEDAFYWNGHYYSVYNDAGSIEDASARCADRGGHLATILTEEENSVLFNEYLNAFNNADIFIGYTQTGESWNWMNGSSARYENWAVNADMSAGLCAMFAKGSMDGRWSSGILNDSRDFYVCEWDYVNKFGYGQDALLTIDAVCYKGHCYALLSGEESWEEKKEICESLGGHLATVTSFEENILLQSISQGEDVMLGMTDKETEGVWQWVTGETSDFSRWQAYQPDNYKKAQHYLVLLANGEWDDQGTVECESFICEWDEVPEEMEYLPNMAANGKFIPPNAYTFNGHYYYVFYGAKTWEEAQEFCEGLGGYLAVVTTAEENAAILPWIPDSAKNDIVVGMTDKEEEGVWKWVNGEQSDYFPWVKGEPNNENNEDYLVIRKVGEWNDVSVINSRYFLCEWDEE